MNLNDYLMSFRDADGLGFPEKPGGHKSTFPLAKRIMCKDGFSISVQATHGAYCSPRQNIGPWYEVECGFPSDVPHEIMGHAEQPDHPTQTVYGYVPIEKVEALLAAHGGMVLDGDQEAA